MGRRGGFHTGKTHPGRGGARRREQQRGRGLAGAGASEWTNPRGAAARRAGGGAGIGLPVVLARCPGGDARTRRTGGCASGGRGGPFTRAPGSGVQARLRCGDGVGVSGLGRHARCLRGRASGGSASSDLAGRFGRAGGALAGQHDGASGFCEMDRFADDAGVVARAPWPGGADERQRQRVLRFFAGRCGSGGGDAKNSRRMGDGGVRASHATGVSFV